MQWLRLRTPNAGGMDSIAGRGTKIPHATQCSWKKKLRKFKKIYFVIDLISYNLVVFIERD